MDETKFQPIFPYPRCQVFLSLSFEGTDWGGGENCYPTISLLITVVLCQYQIVPYYDR